MPGVARPTVVLWDVDETLVHTGGSGARAWSQAFEDLHGVPADIGAHSSAGETDPQVGAATFEATLGRPPSPAEMNALYARYLLALAVDIWVSDGYHVLPGAASTLQTLSDAGIVLGIISGAMEGAARTKLAPADLNRFFVFGGYGSDAPDRTEVARMTLARASRLLDGVEPSAVMIVGDTPHDVQSAAAVGAVAVGVASGHYSARDLAGAGAAHVLGSLEEPFPGI